MRNEGEWIAAISERLDTRDTCYLSAVACVDGSHNCQPWNIKSDVAMLEAQRSFLLSKRLFLSSQDCSDILFLLSNIWSPAH